MPSSDRSYPSVWARPRRQERSALTRDQIVRQALDLLDTEGIEALSMRKLAARLESGTTSLYWHVANRDELIELVIDEIYGEIVLPDAGVIHDWRAATRSVSHSLRSTLLRHPWVVSVFDHVVAAYPGPNQSRMSERMLAVLEAAGFDLAEAERALNTVAAYVTGITMSEAAWRSWLNRRGQTAEDWLDAAMTVTDESTEDHARLSALLTSYVDKDPQNIMVDDFDYGLDVVLDGLRLRLDPAP